MILIIRSGTHEHFETVYREHREHGPIAALVQPQFAELYAEQYPECEIFTFPEDGMFNIGMIRLSWLLALRKKKFSEIILLYNSRDKKGYEHLEFLAIALGGRQVTGVYLNGETEHLQTFVLLPLILYTLCIPLLSIIPFLITLAGLFPGAVHSKQEYCSPVDTSGISFLIPNYNGKHLLKMFLPSVLEEAHRQAAAGRSVEVIIVDDASTDGSREFIEEEFPSVKIVALAVNRGFPGACNSGIDVAQYDLLLLLNNDIKLDPGAVDALLPHFSDPDVFSVSPQVRRLHDNKPLHLRSVAFMQNGKFWYTHDDDDTIVPGEQFVSIGCASLMDLRKVRLIGGFDIMYSPFYAEDTDLGYQALKRGWRILYEPNAVVLHESRATIGVHFSDEKIKTVIERNHILFVWKNIQNIRFIWKHFLRTLSESLFRWSHGDKTKIHALAGAVTHLPAVLKRRIASNRRRIIPDWRIFERTLKNKYIANSETVAQLRRKRLVDNPHKVLLVLPRADKLSPYIPSYGLAALATLLADNGFTVRVLDFNIAPQMPSLHSVIREFQPDVVGFSGYTSMWQQTSEMIDYVYHLGIPVLVGGPHATLCDDSLLDDHRIQYIVKGEAEDVILSVMQRSFDFTNRPEIIQGYPVSLKNQPINDYRMFVNHEKLSVYPLLTSRGCPHNCAFCAVETISSRKWRTRPLEKCIQELHLARERYPAVSKLDIIDSSPSQNLPRFKNFIRMFLDEQFPWSFWISNMRADRVDDELLYLLRRAGCFQLSIGVEHGDPEVFDRIGKGETLDDIRRSAILIKQHGFKLGLCFVVGLPHDSMPATMKSIALARDLQPDYIFWNMMHPFKGTAAYRWFEQNGTFYDVPDFSSYDNLSIYPMDPCVDYPGFTRKQIKKAHFIAKIHTGAYRVHGIRDNVRLVLTSLKYGCLKYLVRNRRKAMF